LRLLERRLDFVASLLILGGVRLAFFERGLEGGELGVRLLELFNFAVRGDERFFCRLPQPLGVG
jgi:hypothetical protein